MVAAVTAAMTAAAPQRTPLKMSTRWPTRRGSTTAASRCLAHARDSTALDKGLGRRQGMRRAWARLARYSPRHEEDGVGGVPG
eukprot:90077-Prymnesium_polylepis.1